MSYQLIKYSVNSGDIYVRNDEKILFISYPYYRIDRVEISENQLIKSDNALHDTFIQVHENYDSLEEIVTFINKRYISEIKKNPLLTYNKVLLEKCHEEEVVAENYRKKVQKRREKRRGQRVQFSTKKNNSSNSIEVEKFIEALKRNNRLKKSYSSNQPSQNVNVQNQYV